MDSVTILWSVAAGVSLTLTAVCGSVWLMTRRDPANLMFCILGIAVASSAYVELCMMHAGTPAEYGALLRWYQIPTFMALMGLVLFVHYYLKASRLWLLWAVILARLFLLVLDVFLTPNFHFSSITSLHQVSLLGEQVSIIGAAVIRPWQLLALASLVALLAYLVDAAIRGWRRGGKDAKRRVLAISLGITTPLALNIGHTQLVAFGFLHVPVSNMPWYLGAQLMMTYELGRDFVLGRHAQMELAALQGQLARMERVSILGQLASMITHELAQPLCAITLNSAAASKDLERQTPDLEELRAILSDIDRDSQRGAEMIFRMRQFFRQSSIEMQPLKVEEVVRDVVSLVSTDAASKKIALSLALQPDLPSISGDRVHLSQVLLNLLMNSIQALQSRPPEAREVVIEARTRNDEVEIAVRDSGHGIAEAIADKLFDPFFTTKPEGMGMGLALSRSIIEAHGGQLWADRSIADRGAIFRFTLLRAPEPNLEAAAPA
jgi:signal transduction histidine kinase